MCFVFVFVALLEYAAVNYFFWGARAKKKKKKERNPLNGATTDLPANFSTSYQAPHHQLAPNGRLGEERKVYYQW